MPVLDQVYRYIMACFYQELIYTAGVRSDIAELISKCYCPSIAKDKPNAPS